MIQPPWIDCGEVFVIGDVCDDVIIRAGAARLSREAPLPVFVWGESVHLGGCAAYVSNQLHALGVAGPLIGLADTSKSRYIEWDGQQVFRIDRPWPPRRQPLPLELQPPTPPVAAVFVDYRGQPPDEGVMAYLRALGCPLIGDSRAAPVGGWGEFDVVKVSAIDLGFGHANSDQELLDVKAAMGLGNTWLLITDGGAGAVLLAEDVTRQPALEDERPILNVSGAGDVFLATFVAGLVANSMQRAEILRLATVAAGLRIRKAAFGGTVSWEEILVAGG